MWNTCVPATFKLCVGVSSIFITLVLPCAMVNNRGVLGSLLALIDADKDGTLTHDEIRICAAKVRKIILRDHHSCC